MIAITGAVGFIGSAVAARISNYVAIDRKWELPENVDTLIHCAGPLETEEPKAMFERCWRFNELLSDAESSGVSRVIYISTVDSDNGYYSLAHRLCEGFLKNHSIPWSVIRLPNVYGLPAASRSFRWHLIPYAFPVSAWRENVIKVRNPSRIINFINIQSVAGKVIEVMCKDDAPMTELVGNDTMSVIEFARLCARRYEISCKKSCGVFVMHSSAECRYWAPIPDASNLMLGYLGDFYDRLERGYYEDVLSKRL